MEYRPLKVGENNSIKGENGYIGTISQIYETYTSMKNKFFLHNFLAMIVLSCSF